MNSATKKNIVIAISGGSGSGKTTIANMLKERFLGDAILLSLDSYYNDLSKLSKREREKINFDHPDSLDLDMFKNNVKKLKNNNAVDEPLYSFETHCRLKDTSDVHPKPIIIIEGLYAFYDKEVDELANYKIYVKAASDLSLIRRIRRDTVERGRDIESVLTQYETTVRTMHNKYIKTQKQKADIIVQNDGDVELDEIIDLLANKIKEL